MSENIPVIPGCWTFLENTWAIRVIATITTSRSVSESANSLCANATPSKLRLILEQNAPGFVAAFGVISRFTVLHSVDDMVRDLHGAEFSIPLSELHQSYTRTFDFVPLLPEHYFLTQLSFTFAFADGRNQCASEFCERWCLGLWNLAIWVAGFPQQQPYRFHCTNNVPNGRRHFICKSVAPFDNLTAVQRNLSAATSPDRVQAGTRSS
jgi:hypothetical protein